MGTKRSFSKTEPDHPAGSEPGPSSGVDSYRGHNGSSRDGRPWKKPKFSGQPSGQNDQTREGTKNQARKRARTIERRLQHPKALPANVRKDLERELASHKTAIDDASAKKQRSKMISKYHMVRFFERQKATRLLRQLRQKLKNATDTDDISKLEKDIHVTEVDIAYTSYFPHLERYVSIYPSASKIKAVGSSSNHSNEQNGEFSSSTKARDALCLQRPKIWYEVEDAMSQGQPTLERLRDRRPRIQQPLVPPASAVMRQKLHRNLLERKGRQNDREKHNEDGNEKEEYDDDDGGFFE